MKNNFNKKELFAKRIVEWYKKEGRSFPWRRTRNPFHILISEMMLQKTDAKKVLAVYPSFIEKYPTPINLAEANSRTLRREIHLLGISDRARRLKETSKTILRLHAGQVPSTRTQLLKLLGVGDYIANAVLCFAFGEDAPLLDTNVVRVIKRVFSVESNKERPRNDRELWQFAESLVPPKKSVDYNRGLLDFAATVCTVRNPKCQLCPIRETCDYYLYVIPSATNKAKVAGS